MRSILKIIIFFSLIGISDVVASEKISPLWEVGGGVVLGILPHYPASDQKSLQTLPFPYFVYRGKIFRSDEKGIIRGRLYFSNNMEVDLSLAGSLPMKSSNSRARTGMPDLDWTAEVGPRIQFTLARARKYAKIDFEIPIRAVISTDFTKVKYVGLISVPELAYQHENFGGVGAQIKLGIGAIFADADLQGMIYGVKSRFATNNRPVYAAKGGYMGSRIQLSFSRELSKSIRIIGAFRGNFHAGAVNKNSPLFMDKSNLSGGIGIIWTIYKSNKIASNLSQEFN